MSGAPEELTSVRPGDVLADKYRVERVLGVGGMGVVVAARHIQLDERVALKFLLPKATTDAAAIARFAREARAAVKIKGEHVARVLDVGTLETGTPYMVMEYLEGQDLDAWLEERGALPVEQAVEFILQACVAIAEAHALGIVHRDLKPANLFCVRQGEGRFSIKVLDFGISKTLDGIGPGGNASLTKTSALMGSPLYMSPEQMRSTKNVDARTDIWSLGIILYQLLVGKTPFDGETIPDVSIKVATAMHAPLGSTRPDVPPGLEAVIDKCLAKEPGDRFRTVHELAVVLAPFGPPRVSNSVDRISTFSTPPVAVGDTVVDSAPPSRVIIAAPPALAAHGTLSTFERSHASKSHGIALAAGIGAVCAVAAIIAMMVSRPSSPQRSAGEATSAATGAEAPTPPSAATPWPPATASSTSAEPAGPSVAPPVTGAPVDSAPAPRDPASKPPYVAKTTPGAVPPAQPPASTAAPHPAAARVAAPASHPAAAQDDDPLSRLKPK